MFQFSLSLFLEKKVTQKTFQKYALPQQARDRRIFGLPGSIQSLVWMRCFK